MKTYLNNYVLNGLKEHWLAVFVSVCVGLLTVVPFLVFTQDDAYRGIAMMGSDAEEHYVARIQEVYDGHPSLGNVFREDKDQPYATAGLGEIIVALIGKVLGMSAVQVNIFSKFLFVFLISFFIYLLVYLMVKIKAAALISSVAPILGYNLISKIDPWLALLRGESIDSMFLVFARPINPEVSVLILVVVLLLLYRAFYEHTSPKWWEIVAIGVLTGSSLYISPYVFSFLGVLIAVSFVWFLIQKQFDLAHFAFMAGAIGLLTTVHFIINYISLSAGVDYAELAMRTGLVSKHLPLLLGFWIPIVFLLVFFIWPKNESKARTFLLITITALFLTINQHVLTGLYLHPGHYHWYITKPLVAIIGGIYVGFILQLFFKNKRLYAVLTAIVIAFFFYNATLWQINSYEQRYPVDIEIQEYATMFDYMRGLEKTESIWAERKLSLYIPIYTHHNAPNNLHVIYYLNPKDFYENGLFLRYRLQKIHPDSVLEVMKKDLNEVSTQIFGMYLRESTGDPHAVPEDVLLDLERKYEVFHSRPFVEVFKDLGVTMVLVKDEERAAHDALPALTEVYTGGGLVLYAVSPR